MAYNGTLVGSPSFVTAATGFGTALALNGTTQYATLPAPLDLTAVTTWSVDVWVKTSTSSGVHLAVASFSGTPNGSGNFTGGGTDVNSWWLGLNAGKAQFNAGHTSSVTTAVSASDNAWHLLSVVVATNSTATIYVDGVQAGTGSISFTPLAAQQWALGAWINTANLWTGTLDECSISSGAAHSGGFTAPGAPYGATRTGQVALYHLDGDATDAATPGIAATPGSMTAGTAQSVALVGTGTAWTTGGGGTTFSLSGGTGASITAQSVTTATAASVTINPGTTAGTLTITDSTDADSVTIAVAASPTTVGVTDANWFFSPATWYLAGSTYAQTACPGAYFKVNFTGTSATLALDTTPLSGASVSAGLYPKLRYSLDNGAFTDVQLASGQNVIFAASASLAAGTHTLECYLLATDNTVDAWTTPSGVWRITGLQVDNGAASAAPTLLSKRALFFGDSITEGAATLAVGSVIASNDSTLTIARLAAIALGAEYGLIAFQQQGYSAATATGRHVPALYTSGNDASTAWNKHFSGQSRLVAGLLSPAPDYIVCLQGVNDAGLSGATVQAAVQAWLGAVRTAAPGAWLIVVIPFGGFTRTRITAGYNAYVAATGDSRAVLLDFGDQTGLTVSTGVANRVSFDGVHPRTTYHAVLGAMLAQGIQRTTAAAAVPPLLLRHRV